MSTIRFSVALAALLPAISDAQPSTQDLGLQSARAVNQKYANPEALDQFVFEPMLGSGKLQTVNGTEVSGSLSCGSHTPFLSLTTGIASTGELEIVQVQTDTDADGAFDHSVTGVPRVSGVCANGFMSCTAGSWNNCRAYTWTLDAGTDLALVEVPVTDVGSCGCIANFCAPGHSAVHLSSLQSQLGGAVFSALASADYSKAITKIEQLGPTITYFGQSMRSCGGSNLDHSGMFQDPNSLDEAVTAAIDANALEAGVFELASTSPSATISNSSFVTQQCRIEREPKLDEVGLFDVIAPHGGATTAAPVGANQLDFTVGRVGNNYYNPPSGCALFEEMSSIMVLRPDRITSAVLTYVQYDDHMQILVGGSPIWNGPYGNWIDPVARPAGVPCERKDSINNDVSVDLMHLMPDSPSELKFQLRTLVGGEGEGFARMKIGINTECAVGEDTFINTCEALQDNAKCRLKDEVVDGVTTFSEYVQTGAVPLTQHLTLSSPSCTREIERPYIQINRTYVCESTPPDAHNLDFAAERASVVEESVSGDGSYQDRRFNSDGTLSSFEGSIPELPSVEVSPCEQTCKVSRPRQANEVAITGVTGEHLAEPVKNDIFYRPCVLQNCPLEDGEVMEAPCACNSSFDDMTVLMQIIRMAGSDMICTTGEPADLSPPTEASP